jgi:hypothetical protein
VKAYGPGSVKAYTRRKMGSSKHSVRTCSVFPLWHSGQRGSNWLVCARSQVEFELDKEGKPNPHTEDITLDRKGNNGHRWLVEYDLVLKINISVLSSTGEYIKLEVDENEKVSYVMTMAAEQAKLPQEVSSHHPYRVRECWPLFGAGVVGLLVWLLC